MIKIWFIPIVLVLGACQPICNSFPEWTEFGYQNDVEHNANGTVATGINKIIGQVLEVPIEPACYIGNQLGIVSKGLK